MEINLYSSSIIRDYLLFRAYFPTPTDLLYHPASQDNRTEGNIVNRRAFPHFVVCQTSTSFSKHCVLRMSQPNHEVGEAQRPEVPEWKPSFHQVAILISLATISLMISLDATVIITSLSVCTEIHS